MNRQIMIVYGILMLILLQSSYCTKISEGYDEVKSSFRVIGYFQGDLIKEIHMVNFSALTHVNVAFANPDSSGVLPDIAGLDNFVSKAHQYGVKVLVSLGGGKAPKYYDYLITETNRTTFISHIHEYVDRYQLDGIDIDLEGALITPDYEGFINELSASLEKGKLLTAAVATEYGKSMPVGALSKMDFVNIMSYDKTGPWRPDRPGQHAPYEMALEDIAYWHEVKQVPKSKLNLGLPFYGHSFYEDAKKGTSYTYNRLVLDYPGAELKDELVMKDSARVFYNGESTIRRKTALALSELGGVMIWQLKQDAVGDKSLLSLIDSTVRTAAQYNPR